MSFGLDSSRNIFWEVIDIQRLAEDKCSPVPLAAK